jgi:pyruvate/2-oxoglutarate dehydrogenase complex dihydrolipoamide acyltransferase (E2) component
MEKVPLIVPNMDLTIVEATILKWLKQVGDAVQEGEGIVQIETDKAVSEVEAPATGVLQEQLIAEGTTVELGTRIGTIETGG